MAPHDEPMPEAKTVAVVADESGRWVTTSFPTPALSPDSMLVRTRAVAINPSDTKMVGPFQTPDTVLGTDFAGVVVKLGSRIADAGGVAVGDRVCGAAHGMNRNISHAGAFASYVATVKNVWLRIPDSWSFEEAASLPAGLCTAGLALRSLGLPILNVGKEQIPDRHRLVLVYGASTATGSLALQLLRLLGYEAIGVCSERNWELARSFGATKCFDYKSASCAADIRAFTKDNLNIALDCITTTESIKMCYAAVGRAGGRYCSLDPFDESVAATRTAIKAEWVLGPMIFGQDIAWPEPYKTSGRADLVEFADEYFRRVQQLLTENKLRPHPQRVIEGDLEQVMRGMDLVKKGVSAQKIVIKLQ